MAKKKVYSFNDRKYSANSIAAVALGMGALAVFAVLLLISFFLGGNAGAWIGACGIAGIIMAIMGLRYGFVSFRDECESYFCSKFGTIVSMAGIVAWFFVVCVGLVNMM